jgi:DNA-binding FadR family transcriptional regulator
MTENQRSAGTDMVRFRALTQASFRLANLLTLERDRLASEFGLTSARWQLLETLCDQGANSSAAQLARELQISRQGVQRMLNELAARKLVRQTPDPQDSRALLVEITAEGEAVLRDIGARTPELRDRVARQYGPDISAFVEQASGLGAAEAALAAPDAAASPANEEREVALWPTGMSPAGGHRMFEAIAGKILEQIRSGQLETGDRLPPERELAAHIGVGRSAVREALRSLEVAGVVSVRRGTGGGAFVRESGSDGIEASIRSMLILGRLPLEALLDVRASLLAQCARIGAQRGTADDFVRLDLAIDELETRVNSSADHLKAIGPATEFYRLAARSTHNPLMVLLVDAIANLVAEMLTSLRHRPRKDSVTARREMVAAMREGRADDAARVIRLHSQDTNQLLLRYKKTMHY